MLSLLNKLNGEQTMLGGKGFMVVASGSMSERHEDNTYLDAYSLDNQFNTYDIIILNQVTSASQLKKYDVIAFVNDKGINVIHRIIDLQYTATGVTYVTRGDSNNTKDPEPVTEDIIVGKVIKVIPDAGIFATWIQTEGWIYIVACLAILGLGFFILSGNEQKATPDGAPAEIAEPTDAPEPKKDEDEASSDSGDTSNESSIR